MTMLSIRDAKNRLTELARQVELGETITVTRNRRPVFDIVPHTPRGGLNLAGLEAYKQQRGIGAVVTDIPAGFDDPLPEDILLTPLPIGT